MDSRRFSVLAAVVGVVVAFGLFLVLKDDTADEDTTVPDTPPAGQQQGGPGGDEPDGDKSRKAVRAGVPVIEVNGGQPVGGVREIEVASGDEIRFVVSSDVDEEVHLHGYDVAQEVSAGGEVEFRVPATIEGVFEVELEHSVVPIAVISVVPS